MKFLAVLVVVAGCATVEDDTSDTSQATLAMPAADAAAIVAFVNYPGTDVVMLDQTVGLDSRAATNIITHRNGPDGVSPSDDDVVFADLASLDSIAYVGDHAFSAPTRRRIRHRPARRSKVLRSPAGNRRRSCGASTTRSRRSSTRCSIHAPPPD